MLKFPVPGAIYRVDFESYLQKCGTSRHRRLHRRKHHRAADSTKIENSLIFGILGPKKYMYVQLFTELSKFSLKNYVLTVIGVSIIDNVEMSPWMLTVL